MGVVAVEEGRPGQGLAVEVVTGGAGQHLVGPLAQGQRAVPVAVAQGRGDRCATVLQPAHEAVFLLQPGWFAHAAVVALDEHLAVIGVHLGGGREGPGAVPAELLHGAQLREALQHLLHIPLLQGRPVGLHRLRAHAVGDAYRLGHGRCSVRYWLLVAPRQASASASTPWLCSQWA